ncbi:citrate lyase beta subunit [Thioflavicoccus mobilis 8321]|uniref:Citrate lyase beta subunit n=1 Tax=Thioflavicoccus mobilis 8321 TaxID=765912 RepID=L0H425_9GAMM|nr:HpcH/HpaI aldolase/citrate lyase family protein [Thioflavicoccus mobilis]AGA92354.1 citrate lyase beta subunit [Thioflavicoccus mobilis 8321]
MQRSPSAATVSCEELEPVRYMALGASLYLPATRLDLAGILDQETLPGLRSAIVCTEDAVHHRDLPAALANLRKTLPRLGPGSLRRFIRPRNPAVLGEIVRFDGVENIDGVVLPKVDEESLLHFAEAAARAPHLLLMPTIETGIVFSRRRLETLTDRLHELDNPIFCLRIGGNDILHLLGLKRPKHLTLYDTPLRTIINDLITIFRPAGFELSSPVFEHIDSPQTLREEVKLDLVHGLWSKTAIHPTQVATIEDAYRVSRDDHDLAREILAADAPAVFLSHGQMVEPTTHSRWALRILERAAIYGIS